MVGRLGQIWINDRILLVIILLS